MLARNQVLVKKKTEVSQHKQIKECKEKFFKPHFYMQFFLYLWCQVM